MIDFIRSNHAQLLTLLGFLIVWVTFYLVIRKRIPEEFSKRVKFAFYGVIGFTFFIYFIFALKFASINETPRSKIDQSVKQNREQYFERDAKKTIENSKKDSLKNN